jgi:hypothetical protein
MRDIYSLSHKRSTNKLSLPHEEIQIRNAAIAKLLGWSEDQPGSWFANTEISQNVVYSEHSNYPHQGLPFHRDWNYLMQASHFIKQLLRTTDNTKRAKEKELFIDEWRFGVQVYYVRLVQWNNGWKMPSRGAMSLSLFYQIGENCEDERDAIFRIISDIAILYHESKI